MYPKSLNSCRLAAILLLMFIVGGSLQAAPEFPALSGRVVDKAVMIPTKTRQAITTRLAEHEKKTGNQVVVLTVRSLQGYPIEEYGYLLGRHWGIGQKDNDNGVLLIVAKNDRKVRIEVGYGLEGVLTDALSKQVIETVILPSFKAGNFSQGIDQGVQAILAITAGESWEPKPDMSRFSGFLVIFLFMIFAFSILFYSTVDGRAGNFGSSHGRYRDPSVSASRYRSGGSSGGFGGGGGFSGGGGSFGGGGASGGW